MSNPRFLENTRRNIPPLEKFNPGETSYQFFEDQTEEVNNLFEFGKKFKKKKGLQEEELATIQFINILQMR